MCDCIEDIEEKLHEECQNKSFRKPYKSVEIERAMIMNEGTLVLKTFSTALVTLEGQKKKIDMKIVHSYCPFCGEKKEE